MAVAGAAAPPDDRETRRCRPRNRCRRSRRAASRQVAARRSARCRSSSVLPASVQTSGGARNSGITCSSSSAPGTCAAKAASSRVDARADRPRLRASRLAGSGSWRASRSVRCRSPPSRAAGRPRASSLRAPCRRRRSRRSTMPADSMRAGSIRGAPGASHHGLEQRDVKLPLHRLEQLERRRRRGLSRGLQPDRRGRPPLRRSSSTASTKSSSLRCRIAGAPAVPAARDLDADRSRPAPQQNGVRFHLRSPDVAGARRVAGRHHRWSIAALRTSRCPENFAIAASTFTMPARTSTLAAWTLTVAGGLHGDARSFELHRVAVRSPRWSPLRDRP